MNKESTKSLIEWEPINERLIRARFNSSYAKTTIIQCYSPTNDEEEEIKEAYYEANINKTPQHDVLLIIGDQNAKVGKVNTEHERAMGKEGHGVMNENGERLANMCSTNGLVIGGTLFKHKDIQTITWNSPNNRDKNQIDHIIINGKWRRPLLDTRAFRGADVNSDHHLVIAKLQLKLKKVPDNNKPGRKIINVNRLKEPEFKQKFVIELRNRFRVLEDLDQTEDSSIEKKWENIKEMYQNTSEKIIGFRKSSNKEWLTSDALKAIDERAKLKEKVLSTRSSRLKEQTQKEYAEKDKEVKKKARKDKRKHLEERAEEAEKAATRGDIRTVYKITKELCGQSKQPPPVKVAFQIVNLLDDGRTVLKKAGRVAKEYEGTGIYKALDSFTQQKYSLLGRQRTFSFDEHNQILMKRLYARKMETVMSREVTAFNVKFPREVLKNNTIGPNNNTIYPVHLKEVFKSEKMCRELFPEGRMLCFYVPYKLKDSNIPLIYSQGTKVLGSFTGGSLLITAGTSFYCSKGHVFVLDVYGTLNNTFVTHLLQHFRKVDQQFANEPIEINIHCMDSGNQNITDAMRQLDIQRDESFRDVHHVATTEMNIIT